MQAATSHAQVTTTITSSGLGTVVTPAAGGTTFVITGGARSVLGSNLFHSFGSFSIGQNNTAVFSNTPQVNTSNIVGRVTGGSVSNIFGTIDTSSYAGANLFLLNPAGIVFGPGAALNVAGSVHATTADFLRFANGDTFCVSACPYKSGTTTPQPSVLSGAEPTNFGFLRPTAAPIMIQDLNTATPLSVPEGRTLSVVGGEIQVMNSSLTAPSGRVQVVSVTGGSQAVPTEPAVSPTGPRVDVRSFSNLGRIEMTGSTLDASDVSGIGGGTVFIRGGQVIIDASIVSANTAGDVDGARVGVDVGGAQSVVLRNTASVGTSASLGGRSGDVFLNGGNVSVESAAKVNTQTFGTGNAGDISVDANTIAVTGGSNIGSLSFGGGASGSVTLTAVDSVTISGRDPFATPSLVNGETFVSGNGGRISVSGKSLILDDGGAISSTTFGEGPGAEISITVGNLSLAAGATIRSHSGFLGRGGDITLRVGGPAVVAGISTDLGPTRIATTSSGLAPAGNISLDVGTLRLTDGALITTGSISDPQGGTIGITAGGPIEISAGGGISSQAFSQDVGQVTLSAPSLVIDNGFITSSTLEAGRAGDVRLNVGTLTLAHGGQVVSSSQLDSPGKGGNIIVTASEGVSISGQAPGGVAVTPFVTDPSSGLFATASERITPDALGGGEIRLSSPALAMSQGGRISVATPGAGPAGDVVINVGQMTLTDGARIDSGTAGVGRAGDILVNVGQMMLTGGARIDSGTAGAGRGGTIDVGTTVLGMSGSGSGLFSNTTGSGPGGSITVRASGMDLRDGATISANATGSGPGGSITVTASDVNLREGATISATSTGTEDAIAGSINVTFGNTLRLENSRITTDSRLADGGNISITSTGSKFRLFDSQITTSVRSGEGGGGNIQVGTFDHPFSYIVLKDGGIHADAFGGPGGNININSKVLLTNVPIQTAITASSEFSSSGTISVNAFTTDVSGAVAELPSGLAAAAVLLRASCAARMAEGKASSLVVAGREGVPVEPGGFLPSELTEPGGTRAASDAPRLSPIELRTLRLSYLDTKCGG
jgi:filamentous hemagglutinin family protein